MWKTISRILEENGLSKVTLQQAANGKDGKPGVLGNAARREGKTWLIDDEHVLFTAWLDAHWKQARVVGNTYFIKAAGPGPSYVEIKRAGTSLSDFRDLRNHMLLSDEQEAGYQQAFLLVKENKKQDAFDVLMPLFEKCWIEE